MSEAVTADGRIGAPRTDYQKLFADPRHGAIQSVIVKSVVGPPSSVLRGLPRHWRWVLDPAALP